MIQSLLNFFLHYQYLSAMIMTIASN